MFDPITESMERPLRERSVRSKIVSVGGHMAVLFVVFGLLPPPLPAPLPPAPPTMMAFVAAAPDAPPPPPPPPAPVRAPRATAPAAPPQPTLRHVTAPIPTTNGIKHLAEPTPSRPCRARKHSRALKAASKAGCRVVLWAESWGESHLHRHRRLRPLTPPTELPRFESAAIFRHPS